MYEVDDVQQVITFSFNLFCKWVEPSLSAESPSHRSSFSGSGKSPFEDAQRHDLPWTPTFFFANMLEMNIVRENYSLNRSDGTVIAVICYVLKIKEILELSRFPFDRQVLKLDISSYRCHIEPWNEEKYNREPSFVTPHVTSAGFYNAMWTLERYDAEINNNLLSEHVLYVRLYASRNPRFYMINFGTVNFLIVVLSLTTTAVAHENYHDRASITLTLLLTGVAFKFVVTNYVPPTKYVTLLDQYMLLGLVILGVVAFENYVVSFLTKSASDIIDIVICYVIIFCWIVFHIYLVMAVNYGWFRKGWDKVLHEDDCDAKFIYGEHFKIGAVVV